MMTSDPYRHRHHPVYRHPILPIGCDGDDGSFGFSTVIITVITVIIA
jgi:hypothetical protein